MTRATGVKRQRPNGKPHLAVAPLAPVAHRVRSRRRLPPLEHGGRPSGPPPSRLVSGASCSGSICFCTRTAEGNYNMDQRSGYQRRQLG